MEFNFVEDEGDEEVLDLEDLVSEKGRDEDLDSRDVGGVRGRVEKAQQAKEEVVSTGGFAFSLEEDIPERKTLADPEVKTKAQASRRAQPRAYGDRIAQGWSLYCAHQQHLPNLCEREQDSGKVECACPCHPERGYVYREPESEDSESELLLLDLT